MTVVVVTRPPRDLTPRLPAGEVRLMAPPQLPPEQGRLTPMTLLPTLAMAVSAVFFLLPGTSAVMKVMGALLAASTLAMVVAHALRARQGSGGAVDRARREYLGYLDRLREQVHHTARAQRAHQFQQHPEPRQLWAVVADGRRVWERRIGDEDFGQVRFGLGPQRLATPLVPPTALPGGEVEPLTAAAMRRFLAVHGAVDELPVTVGLRALHHLTVSGEPHSAQAMVRAVLAQLATLHSPQDLVMAVAAGHGAVRRWDWVKWLPHAQWPGAVDGAGSRRLICEDLAELAELLARQLDGRPRFRYDAPPLLDRPHLVLVLDRVAVPEGSALCPPEGLRGVTVIEIVPGRWNEPRDGLSMDVHPGTLTLYSPGGQPYQGRPDTLSEIEAAALARQLAPLRLGGDGDGNSDGDSGSDGDGDQPPPRKQDLRGGPEAAMGQRPVGRRPVRFTAGHVPVQ